MRVSFNYTEPGPGTVAIYKIASNWIVVSSKHCNFYYEKTGRLRVFRFLPARSKTVLMELEKNEKAP